MNELAMKIFDIVEGQGWDDNTVLGLCFTYIERQQDDDAFIEFIQRVAEEENAIT